MSMHATGLIEMKTWDEKPYDERAGMPKLTRASVTNAFRGDIEGESTLEYLMAYRDDGSATFVGLERVIGRIGDRAGSFVLQHAGIYDAGTATATCSVVPGSGTGDLRDLRGDGRFMARHGEPASLTLDYDLGVERLAEAVDDRA